MSILFLRYFAWPLQSVAWLARYVLSLSPPSAPRFAHMRIVLAFDICAAVDPGAHNLLGLGALHLLVFDTRPFLLFPNCRRFVEAIVRPQVEDEDVVCRINTLSSNLLENRVLAAADGFILIVHDGACSHGSVIT